MKGKRSRYSTKKWWQRVLAVICCVAVFAAMFFPAIGNVWAQETSDAQKVLICGKEEHTHTDACYTLTCTNTDPAHVHDASCYTLTCGKEEHTHTDACYEDETTAGIAASPETATGTTPSSETATGTPLPSEAATGTPLSSETATGTTPSSETTTDITTSPQTESSSASDSSESATDESAAITKAPASESSPQGNIDESQTKIQESETSASDPSLQNNSDEAQTGTEKSEALASDSNLQNNIDEAQTKIVEEKAVALEFPDEQTSTVENALGYTIKGAHEETTAPASDAASMMFALEPQLVGSSDYRFNAYYVLYANNLATTKTDTVQDLIGNMDWVKQTIKYQLDFHNDTDYAVGEVVIRVPYSIYNDRYGNPVTPSDIGVPEAPATSSSSSFNYTIDTNTNELVITNYKPIISGSNNLLQIFYAIDDMASVDSSIGAAGTHWTIQPDITVKGVDGNADITLTGSIDTKTELSVTDKVAYEENGSVIYPELYTQSQIETAMGNALPAGFTADFTNNH